MVFTSMGPIDDSPLKYTASVYSDGPEQMEEMKRWCEQNCEDLWFYPSPYYNRVKQTWFFSREGDVTLFLLTWG